MAQPVPKSSPLTELCSALPSLPMRLQQVGRFVAANDYDATTRSMRDLAAEAGADPASFTDELTDFTPAEAQRIMRDNCTELIGLS